MVRKEALVKEVRAKNRASNVMLCLVAVFDVALIVLVIHLVGSALVGGLPVMDISSTATIMLLCLAGKAVCSYGATWSAHKAAYSCLVDIRLRIVEHLKSLPLGFFQKRRTGDLSNVMQNDVEQVEVYLAHGLPETMSATLLPSVIFVLMLAIDWRLALAMVVGLPLMWLVKRFSAPLWKKGFAIVAKYTTSMQESLMEYVENMPVIKAFGKEEDKTAKTIAASRDYVRWVTKSMNGISMPMGLIDLFMESGVVLVMMLGIWLFSVGAIGFERLILAMALASLFTSSVAKMATLQHYGFMFNQAMAGVSSILSVPAPERPKGAEHSRSGDVVLSDVSFSYSTEGEDTVSLLSCRKTLNAVSLTFREGSRNALVGSSGCGKTTLASLLMGFWQPDSGEISVGGTSLAELSERQIGSLFSIVQQDTFLFNLSIEENIRIGKPGATHDDVVEAAKRSRAHGFIEALPKGYATGVGEAGIKFSGGEKQRIAVARMILKDAPVIILDEATAAVDAENEALIQAAIDDLAQGKTVIAIAHHLSTVRGADQIVVMDEGRVEDRGTHSELMGCCSLYRTMVEDQVRVDNWKIKE